MTVEYDASYFSSWKEHHSYTAKEENRREKQNRGHKTHKARSSISCLLS